MTSGYSRPVLMIDEGVAKFDDVLPTPVVIKGSRHLVGVSGDIVWEQGVSAGEVTVEIIPTLDYPDDADGELIIRSNIVADAISTVGGPVSKHYNFFGLVPYIRHKITVAVVGGSVTTYHDGSIR